MKEYQREFLAFAAEIGALRFGEFRLKSGRHSPYFFNAGLFDTGDRLARLAHAYARCILDRAPGFDLLFGPAYKGIPLAAATSMALADEGHDIPYAFNRKEVKDHGEGGLIVGRPLSGRVLIIDDVITAGTSVRESVEMLRAAGATPVAVLIALDRMEKSGNATEVGEFSAVQAVERDFGIPVFAIANLSDLMSYLDAQSSPDLVQYQAAVKAYRERYGV